MTAQNDGYSAANPGDQATRDAIPSGSVLQPVLPLSGGSKSPLMRNVELLTIPRSK